MQTTYRFCVVDPRTWLDNRVIEDVREAEITYDLTLPTGGTMTMTTGEDLGEVYVRVYMIQDGREYCIGTFLAQTGRMSSDGRARSWSIEAYSPLIELSDDMPCIGETAQGWVRVAVRRYIEEHCRAPVFLAGEGCRIEEPFSATAEDTWLTFVSALMEKDDCYLMPAPDGTIIAIPRRSASAMSPVFRFSDDSASVVEAEIEDERDLYGIPNTVEVIAENGMVACAQNENADSPLSLEARGRTIRYRETSPALPDNFDLHQLERYAEDLLERLAVVEHVVTFTHDWVPNVKVGDCVRLNFRHAGIHANAIVQSARLSCDKNAKVSCTAAYTEVMR